MAKPRYKAADDDEEPEPNVPLGGQISDTEDDDEKKPVPAPEDHSSKRMTSFKIRTMSTVTLLAMMLFIIWAGHIPTSCLVLILQIAVMKEGFDIARVNEQEHRLPGFRALQWYFFFVTVFYLYLRFIKKNLLFELTSKRIVPMIFKTVLKRHTLISFCMYMAGFVSFVLGLKRGSYLYQFGQYAWTHMIIIVTVIPSSFFISNIFEGMIWWMLPSLLIIVNDICAYLFGFFLGRTPLIKLSPKKTWEGFIGGFFSTMVVAFFLSALIAQSKWFTCPRRDLSMGPLDCERDELYIPRVWTLEEVASDALPDAFLPFGDQLLTKFLPGSHRQIRDTSFVAMPLQLHSIVLGAFASLIAPFGGFFASGFKRAFKRKDFGDTIPGHGGITDRFDCMIIMAMFSYLYYWGCISKANITVGDVLNSVLKLDEKSQLELFTHLGNLLVAEGAMPGSVLDCISVAGAPEAILGVETPKV